MLGSLNLTVEWGKGDVARVLAGGWGWVEASLWGRRALAARGLYSTRLEAVHAKPSEHLFLAAHRDFPPRGGLAQNHH